MRVMRILAGLVVPALVLAASPAAAQFYFKPPNLAGSPVTGAEPGMVTSVLPDATDAELRAALVWNMRAALNVAALQCQFTPMLRTLDNYNALLRNHDAELKTSYDRLSAYFIRVAPSKKAGQAELDRYGTRVYSGFSTVGAQYTFCEVSGRIAYEARFSPRGTLGDIAVRRMRELRNSLVPNRDQQFPARTQVRARSLPPQFANPKCWKKDVYNAKRCGAIG